MNDEGGIVGIGGIVEYVRTLMMDLCLPSTPSSLTVDSILVMCS